MSTSITHTASRARARCVELAGVFQDQLLEEPLPPGAPATLRHRQEALTPLLPQAPMFAID